MKPKDEDDAIFARIHTDKSEVKASGNRGCAIVVVAWLALMALACLGWFGGQVYQVWTG